VTPTTSPPGATAAPGASYPPVVGGTGAPTITSNGTTTATIAPTIVVGGTSNDTSNNDTVTALPTNSPVQQQVPSGPSDATRIMTAASSRTGLLIIITAVAWLGL
jgi:hypothetical protein